MNSLCSLRLSGELCPTAGFVVVCARVRVWVSLMLIGEDQNPWRQASSPTSGHPELSFSVASSRIRNVDSRIQQTP